MTLTPQDFVSKWKRAEARERQNSTFTHLDHQHSTWLDLAYKKLDAAVCIAFGWLEDLLAEQVLEKLFVLNLERAKNGEVGYGKAEAT